MHHWAKGKCQHRPWRANLGAEVRARIVPAIGNLAQETGDFRPFWPLDIGVPVSNVYPLYPLGRKLLFLICSRPLSPHFPQLRTVFSFLQDLGFPLYFLLFLILNYFFFKAEEGWACPKRSTAAGVVTDRPEQRAARPLHSEPGGTGTSPCLPCPSLLSSSLG